MNKIAVGIAAGAVVAAASAYGTLIYPQMRAKQEVDKAIAELPQGVQASYQDLRYSLFTDRLILSNFRMSVTEDDDTLTSDIMVVNVTGASRDRVRQLHAVGFIATNSDASVHINVDEIKAEDISSPLGVLAGVNAPNPTSVSVKNATFQNVRMTIDRDDIRVREIAVSDFVQADMVPLSLTFGIHGMLIEPGSLPDQEARDALAKLGYDKLSLNFDLSYAHSPDSKRLSIKQASIGGDGIGQLSFSIEMGGIETAAIQDPALLLAAAQTATLESAELRYDDASLAGRVLKLAAAEAEMEEPQFKAMLLSQLAEAGGPVPAAPLTKEMVDSATAFLSNPKSLSLRLKPAQPVPLFQLMNNAEDPVALATAVGISVTANR